MRWSDNNKLFYQNISALLAEAFLDRTASQLTYHGLYELNSTVKENQLCVFFRNNHFSTLYKHKVSMSQYGMGIDSVSMPQHRISIGSVYYSIVQA